VTLLGQGVGLGDPQRSLPTPNILWFCGVSSRPCRAGGLRNPVLGWGRFKVRVWWPLKSLGTVPSRKESKQHPPAVQRAHRNVLSAERFLELVGIFLKPLLAEKCQLVENFNLMQGYKKKVGQEKKHPREKLLVPRCDAWSHRPCRAVPGRAAWGGLDALCTWKMSQTPGVFPGPSSRFCGACGRRALALPGHAQPAPACPQPHWFCTISTSFPVIPGTLLCSSRHRSQQSSKCQLWLSVQRQPGVFNTPRGKAARGKPKASDFLTRY